MPSTSFTKIATAIIAMSASAMAAPTVDRRAGELSLTAQLSLADSTADRYALLPNDEDFVYDFNEPHPFPFATGKTFPALVGNGQSIAAGPVPACAVAVLHLHPRSSEAFTVTAGRILTEMVPEGFVSDAEGKPRIIRTELTQGQMTIFPMGSFHAQTNPDCDEAYAVASFHSEDPGFSGAVGQTLSFSNDTIISNFGHSLDGADIERYRHALPAGTADAVDSCLAKCGIQKRSFH